MLPLFFQSASAFCGFYVGGADAQLYNDATMVVMLRDGTQTVLSMQNTYTGPPEDFALVIPVPEVLDQEDVKTLDKSIFAKIDRLSAPRLVEYFESDPCDPYQPQQKGGMIAARASGRAPTDAGVKIEAQFSVAEYDILILSAKDSSGLEKWLRKERYNIPAGASEALRPYVESGTKFFVAKVDPKRVTFEDERAVLSPLRVAYDSERFALPVRLGLLNSGGEQDLLIHLLGKNTRFDVANYPNTLVPTNLQVRAAVRDDFGSFYEALFRNTIDDHPGAVVTEYAWQASNCDPCPGPTLSGLDIQTLGGDIVGSTHPDQWTLTRLHYRYTEGGLDEDLVFRSAEPIIGGRGTPNAEGRFEESAQAATTNQFQGRYAILHPWDKPTACEEPQRGIWGGPNGRRPAPPRSPGSSLASRPENKANLESLIVTQP